MCNKNRSTQRQCGTTFLEMLIAVLIMAIITAAIFQLYVVQHDSYLSQDDVANVQQNARASIDELARHIRMAGFDLPLGVAPVTAANTDPDTITARYHHAGCETQLASDMVAPSSQLTCSDDVSCFEVGQAVYVCDPDSGGGEWFKIGQLETSTKTLVPIAALSKGYRRGALVQATSEVKFYIDNASRPDHPCLMVKLVGQPPQTFAEDIEDLQLQYRMKNGLLVDVPVVAADVREVLITVTGRSRNISAELADRTGVGYRTRSFSTSVHVRNIGS